MIFYIIFGETYNKFMKILPFFALAFIIAIALISCGDDNPQTNNNNGTGTETLIYSRDTFNIETNQSGNFYTFNELTANFDTCHSIRLSFTIYHNLDTTNSRGLITYINDSLTTENMRGNHSIQLSSTTPSTSLTIYNIIYFSNTSIQKYIRVRDIKIYKIN